MKLLFGIVLSLVVSLAVSNPSGKLGRQDEDYEEDDGYYNYDRGEYNIDIE